MNLIDRIAKLRELEAKATSGECIAIEDDDRSGDFLIIQNKEHWAWKDGSNSPDAQYLAALRNAASAMLDILGEIRPGDAMIFGFIMSGEYGQNGCGCTKCQEATDCLRRYQAMAQRMEAENK